MTLSSQSEDAPSKCWVWIDFLRSCCSCWLSFFPLPPFPIAICIWWCWSGFKAIDGGVVKAYELKISIRLFDKKIFHQLFWWNIPGSMLGHHSFTSILFWFAQNDVNFGGEETSQLDKSALGSKINIVILLQDWVLNLYLMDKDMASVTIRRVLVGAVRKSGIKAIHRTQVV